ncbi:hypothetical protein AZE42_13388, partial [Rhizopogon vesiculosus]
MIVTEKNVKLVRMTANIF